MIDLFFHLFFLEDRRQPKYGVKHYLINNGRVVHCLWGGEPFPLRQSFSRSWNRRGSINFLKGRGGLRRKILKEKCLLIHVSTRVHIETRQSCNSFSLLPFQEDCLLFVAFFYYFLLFLKFERGGVATPVTPPSRSANGMQYALKRSGKVNSG